MNTAIFTVSGRQNYRVNKSVMGGGELHVRRRLFSAISVLHLQLSFERLCIWKQ